MHKSKRSLYSLMVYYAVILLIMIAVARDFFTAANFNSIFRSTAITLVAAVGMMLVLVIGEIDVSVGAILAMCCVVCGELTLAGIPLLGCIAASMLVGALMGSLNGFIVTFLRLDSIVATLGMLSIYKGLRIIWTNGEWVTGFSKEFLSLGQESFLGINHSIYVAVVVLLAGWFVMTKTTFGRNCYAVGTNPESAKLSGINVRRIKILAFMICGLLVGLAAVMYTSRFGSVQSNTGNGWEMTIISACVVGGTSTAGGEGEVPAVALGAILISALTTLLVFLGIDSLWQEAVQGMIILLSVCTYSIKLPSLGKNKTGGIVQWEEKE